MTNSIPDTLAFSAISLRCKQYVQAEGHSELVPYYHFGIFTRDNLEVGHINFRLGDTQHILKYAGHIGYEVLEGFRGHSYSYFACKAIVPFIKQHYNEVVITAEVGNIRSIHTIERLGAEFLENISVPKCDPAYAGGARKKARYKWIL